MSVCRVEGSPSSREALLIELANARRVQEMPVVKFIKPSQVEAFGQALRQKLLANDSSLAKSYLNLLVEEIRVTGKEAVREGSYSGLASALSVVQGNKADQVPSFIHNWRARRDSNSRPPGS